MNKFDIAIIGAGAAGSMAAIQASQNRKQVILIERNDKIGKKILATGNGRCNLTNINTNPAKYHGADFDFISSILNQFNAQKTMEFFENLGIILKEENNGRIFPRNNQASTVVDGLEYELKRKKIVIKTNSLVRSIKKEDIWKIKLDSGNEIHARKLIITTGGKASHHLGSSGDGYFWVEKLGHKIVPTYPALTPIEIKEIWIQKAQGIKIEGKVAAKIDDKIVCEKTGDILFTHFGISGPAVMAQARVVAPNLGKNIKICIDLFPDITKNQLDKKIQKIFEANGAKSPKNCLAGIIADNLSAIIIDNLGFGAIKKSAEFSKLNRLKIVGALKNIVLTPTNVRPFKEAQVTSGGIDSREIDPATMQSKIIADLYFAGEIIDVDGDSGGFNLQWAWSSGYLAGKSATQ